MDRMSIDDTIVKALETWYEKDHPLHLDPLHPAIALAGEAGELLDLYKKERFKDGVSWWDCVCGHEEHDGYCNKNDFYDDDPYDDVCVCRNYTPKILDELGDLWYYIRILAYQREFNLEPFEDDLNLLTAEVEELLAMMNYCTAGMLVGIVDRDYIHIFYKELHRVYIYFRSVLKKLGCTLPELTELNWQKLKDGDNNGWKEARLAKRRNSISSNED